MDKAKEPIVLRLRYAQRRILGQLASLPAAWQVSLDPVDEASVTELVKLCLVTRRYIAGFGCLFSATDDGRREWKAATEFYKHKEPRR